MSKIEDIHTSMWSDPDFEVLGRDASLLLIWSWTNTRCGMAGLYKVSRRAMTESKVALEDLDAALDELRQAGMVFYEENVIFVRVRVKRLRQKTEQIAKAIAKDVGLIDPEHPLRVAFLTEYARSTWLRDKLATLTGPSGDTYVRVNDSGSIAQEPRPSVDPLPRVQGNGNGKGKGNGKGNTDSRATLDHWAAWAERNLPGLPSSFVVSAAMTIHSAGHEVTPEAVTERLAAMKPHLFAGEQAA